MLFRSLTEFLHLPHPAIGTAESEEPVQDEVNVEIPSEDGIYEEVTPTEIPVEEEPIDTPIPENPSEEVSTEEPAIDDNPDTDSTFEEITDTDPEEMPEHIKNAILTEYEKWHSTIGEKIKDHENLDKKEIHVFLMSFPSVDEFRKCYLKTIK